MLVATACNAWVVVVDNMQNKAKIVAISGVCGGIAVMCLLALAIPGARWVALILAVLASVAVAIPTMVSGKPVFSVIVYLVSAVFGVWANLANVIFVAPVVAFCMPMAIIKVFAETPKLSLKVQDSTIEDPFDNGDDKQVKSLEIQATPRMKGFVKWILYYVVLEIGIALTLFATYLFTPVTFELIWTHKLLVWLLVALQLLPIPYDMLLRGAFTLTAKALRRHISQE
jgi:hypothetical protein